MTAGDDFERLTEEIFIALTSAQPGVTVERDVRLPGVDGPRQIDVVVRSSVGPIPLTTLIECKDFKRKIDVTRVDALHSVMADVNASKGVIVSRKGFSGTAVQKARRLGISLIRADHLSNLEDVTVDVPIYVRELRQTGIRVVGELHLDGGTTIEKDAFFRLNDLDLADLLRTDLMKGRRPDHAEPGEHQWHPTSESSPWFIRDSEGRRRDFDDLIVTYELAETHYFGYVNDVDAVVFLHDEIEGKQTLLLPAEKLAIEYSQLFAKFNGISDLPVEPKLRLDVVVLPGPDDIRTTEFSLVPSLPHHQGRRPMSADGR